MGLVATLATACGGGDDGSAPGDRSTTEPVPTTEAAVPATEPATEATTPTTGAPDDVAEGVIASYDEVQPAVIQIEARGTLRDPEIGTTWGGGRGSGFIISPDGLAVTNNHVVTGAATLEVFVGGDASQGYNATVVGVSECNDLALIRISAKDPLPYLEWTTEAPTVGTEVYTAGFPLGDPEFTMTRGIVAKAAAFGDTPWASIDSTIEHDANIQPGNSGGPLVGVDGRVVGVNYAKWDQTGTAQFYAIEAGLAQDVVERLVDGDFESLGINGTAVVDDASGIAGVWVAGTAPGSPASNAGLLPGDIVTMLNGLPIGTDGTMKDYCDVIRTAGDRPINVEILRFDTQEVLRGELNGDLPLEQVFSFAEEIEDETGPVAETGDAYTGTRSLVDDTGRMTVEVPTEWADVDTAPLDDLPWISASPSLDAFYGSYDVPGMALIGYPELPVGDIPSTIAEFAPAAGECGSDEGLFDYDDGFFVGQYELWADCGTAGAVVVVLVANANSGAGSILLWSQLVTEADFDALDLVMSTFDLAG